MRRIPVIALIVLLLVLPIPAVAHDATPATSPASSTLADARATGSAAVRAAPPCSW